MIQKEETVEGSDTFGGLAKKKKSKKFKKNQWRGVNDVGMKKAGIVNNSCEKISS